MILFIDTHDELITIALKIKDNLYIKTKESEYSHSVYTMPMIASIFDENNLDIKDLDKLPRISDRSQLKQYINLIDSMNSDIDFEELAKEYDGIMVWMYRSKDIDEEARMFDGMYYRMYDWDVDTLVVFNQDIIEEVDA